MAHGIFPTPNKYYLASEIFPFLSKKEKKEVFFPERKPKQQVIAPKRSRKEDEEE